MFLLSIPYSDHARVEHFLVVRLTQPGGIFLQFPQIFWQKQKRRTVESQIKRAHAPVGSRFARNNPERTKTYLLPNVLPRCMLRIELGARLEGTQCFRSLSYPGRRALGPFVVGDSKTLGKAPFWFG